MSASAQRGLDQFRLANCVTCHQIEGPYATFGSTRFFNTGVAATSFTTLSDQGRWKVTGNEIDRGAFRPPSLRNVALRAPYMHDGSLKSLEEVIQFYVGGGRANAWRSPELVAAPRGAAAPTAQDLQDLLEFLQSLTGDMPENAGPPEETATGNPPALDSGPVSVTSINAVGGGLDVAQNTWIEIKGTNLAPAGVGAGGLTWSTAPEFASGKMPTQLRGVSVKVNGKAAYVYYISPTQVNVLTPLDGTQASVPVQLTNGAGISAPFTVKVKSAAPAFLLLGATRYIAATHVGGGLLGPTSMSVPGYAFTPAQPNETIILYANGFGLPSATLIDGSASQFGALPALPVIQVGDATATVTFAGVVSPGLFQFNLIVPANATSGDNPVTASYGGFTTPASARIMVQR